MPPVATKKAAASKKTAPAKKVTPAKKAAAKKAAATTEEMSTREARRQENLEVGQNIVSLRDNDELSWAAISEQLGIGQGKAMLLYMYASVPEEDKITAPNEESLGKKIVKARESGLSWGQIMARTGLGEGKCRSLFEAASGDTALGNRIGKGGRYPTGVEAPAKPAKAAGVKKGAAKKAAGSTKKGAGAVELPDPKMPLADYTLPQLQKRLNGTVVTVNTEGGGVERIKVKAVTAKKQDGSIVVQNDSGKSQTILSSLVKSATKPKP